MVLINIDMPGSCYRCPLMGDKSCQAVGPTKEYINGRQDNCPIVDPDKETWLLFNATEIKEVGHIPISAIDDFQKDLADIVNSYDSIDDQSIRSLTVWEIIKKHFEALDEWARKLILNTEKTS